MQLNLNSGILLIGIVQGLLLMVSLNLHQNGPVTANRYLSAMLAAFVVALTTHFLTITNLWQTWVHVYLLASTSVFLFGPFLYFYVQQLTQPEDQFSFKKLWHFLPFLLNLMLFVPMLSLPSEELIAGIMAGQDSDRTLSSLALPLIKIAVLIGYTLYSLRLWLLHNHRVKQQFSDLENKSLIWLRNLLVGFLVFESLFLLMTLFQSHAFALPNEIDSVLSLILVALIFMTGFYGLHQPEIFRSAHTPRSTTHEPLLSTTDDDEKASVSASSNLNEALKGEIAERLNHAMRSEKIYLERFLDLRGLAAKCAVSPHQLSEYLNDTLKVNFYDYVNQHRVEAAQEKLISSKDSILDIALTVGFNNKATFNKAFKKHTGTTPSLYRKGQ
ncbi:helix-turn-helix domain-containing protein [Alteromonas facilis]|uniref:helix-turn-helix domain-containing protein n=1 Tax=Alteromonas facilis TaxID=2048004 RepID=UPI000C289F16|nr:helix-turn-helix transcriptional regulator [Alteromonas facilis]